MTRVEAYARLLEASLKQYTELHEFFCDLEPELDPQSFDAVKRLSRTAMGENLLAIAFPVIAEFPTLKPDWMR